MIHYSCDRCHRTINVNEEIRYVVKIEVQLAVGERESEVLNESSLEELEQMLDDMDLLGEEASISNEKTFDLCSGCYAEYIDNPLAVEPIGINFSQN